MAAPEKLTIDTPEQIALEYTLASAGSRFLAIAIDTLVQVAMLMVLGLIAFAAMFLGGSGAAELALWIQAALLLLAFTLYYGYFAIFEAIWSGQTPGKRAVRLRVITAGGRPITVFDAILRNLLRIVDQLPGIYAVGLTSIFLTTRSQRLGDLAAGTVVVHEEALRHDAPGGAAAGAGSVHLGAHRLQPNELEAIETFLKRSGDLPPGTRELTARKLAQHLRSRLSLRADQFPSDEAMLEALVSEYRASRGRR